MSSTIDIHKILKESASIGDKGLEDFSSLDSSKVIYYVSVTFSTDEDSAWNAMNFISKLDFRGNPMKFRNTDNQNITFMFKDEDAANDAYSTIHGALGIQYYDLSPKIQLVRVDDTLGDNIQTVVKFHDFEEK